MCIHPVYESDVHIRMGPHMHVLHTVRILTWLPSKAPFGSSDVAVAATLRRDSSRSSGLSLKEMSKLAMVSRVFQNLPPLTCSFLLPPQAAEENVVPFLFSWQQRM